MDDLPAFSAQKKAKCVTWNYQTGSITQTQRNYCTMSEKFYPPEFFFYNGLETLTNMEGYEVIKHQEDLKCHLVKRKKSLIILSDTQRSLYKGQRKI